LLSGTFGVAWHLNLKLGATLGWGLVPDGTPREVRERDTFFAIGLLAWGVLAGGGLAALARQRGAVLLALAGGWVLATRASFDRNRAPLTEAYAAGLARVLDAAPPASVVLAATDWDAFGLWHVQAVEGRRRDLAVVVLGLLPEPGYRARLEAVAPGLVPPAGSSEAAAIRHVQAWALARRRRVVMGPWSLAPVRRALGTDSATVRDLVPLAEGPPRTSGAPAPR
ncbi:MAG: hypothetical protein MUF53_06545, partial [Gemmatimonadaceae bacterium]|nr:hypothetical protein [Gemmatimonadaceae bacterium]